MEPNVGTWDRALRVVLGSALLSLAVAGPRIWWGLVGLVPFMTGFLGYCPLYRVLGIGTCPRRAVRKA